VSQPYLPTTPRENAFASLRHLARKRLSVECCDMCTSELPPGHQHLIDPLARKIVCACNACAILFSNQGGTKYKRVPRRIRFLPTFKMSEAQWESLMIPIEMSFFFRSGNSGKVCAFYPGPAGATESLLSLEAWADIEEENPALREMELT